MWSYHRPVRLRYRPGVGPLLHTRRGLRHVSAQPPLRTRLMTLRQQARNPGSSLSPPTVSIKVEGMHKQTT